MAKNKQLRDKNGRFASKEGAQVKKSSKKKEAAVDWQAAYDKKVFEMQKLECECKDDERIIAEMDGIIDELRKKLEVKGNYVRKLEEKNKLFFETIEKQNNHASELRAQLDWFKEKLPWYKKCHHFITMEQMHEKLCYLQMKVIESMYSWK